MGFSFDSFFILSGKVPAIVCLCPTLSFLPELHLSRFLAVFPCLFIFSCKGFIMHRVGRGPSPWQLLSSWQPGHHSALLASSWHDVCVSALFLMRACLSLETLSSSDTACLRQKPLTSWIMSHRNLVCLVRHPQQWLCLRLLVFLITCGLCCGPWPRGSAEPWLCSLMTAMSETLCLLTFILHATFWIISFDLTFQDTDFLFSYTQLLKSSALDHHNLLIFFPF